MGMRPVHRDLLVPAVTRVLLMTVGLMIGGAGLATAERITVTFTVAPAAGDPINPAPASGSFSFDSSLIPAGGGVVGPSGAGLGAESIAFSWSGTAWNNTNADLWTLEFDTSGALSSWFLFGAPLGPGITVAGNVVNDFALFPTLPVNGQYEQNRFVYTDVGTPGFSFGTVVAWQVESGPAPVPEPATLVLLGAGLVGVWTQRRRHRRLASAAALPQKS
jgi:hypothetical protein